MKNVLLLFLVIGVMAGWYIAHRPPAPRGPRMAADGTYFLRSYYSLSTPTGVVGWLPGQELHARPGAVPQDGSITVGDGRFSAAVPADLLTQNMDEADNLMASDQFAQNQAQNAADAQRALDAQREMDAKLAAADRVQRTNQLFVASSTIGTYDSRLRDPATRANGGSYSGGAYIVSVPGRSVSVRGGAASPGTVAAGTQNTFSSGPATAARYSGDHAPNTSLPMNGNAQY